MGPLRVAAAASFLFLFFLFLSIADEAGAQACGATLSGKHVLSEDLTCPRGNGLELASGAVLDCAGHAIRGGGGSAQYGIYVAEAAGVEVRNCTILEFGVGIRLRAASDCVLRENVVEGNVRYGVEITRGSTGNTVIGNAITSNGDEGIHLSGPAAGRGGNRILQNAILENRREGIYLIGTSDNEVSDNLVQGHESAGILLKRASLNRLEGNDLTGDTLQLGVGSRENVIRDTSMEGQGLRLYRANGNHFEHLTIAGAPGRPDAAIELRESRDNRFTDAQLVDPFDYHVEASDGSVDNSIDRLEVDGPVRCLVDATSGSVEVTDRAGDTMDCEAAPAPTPTPGPTPAPTSAEPSVSPTPGPSPTPTPTPKPTPTSKPTLTPKPTPTTDPANQPPRASIRTELITRTTGGPDIVELDGSQSLDRDGRIVAYDFLVSERATGRAVFDPPVGPAAILRTPPPGLPPGTYRASLVVFDDDGAASRVDDRDFSVK